MCCKSPSYRCCHGDVEVRGLVRYGEEIRGSFMEDKGCWVRKVHSAGKLIVEGARADQVPGVQTGGLVMPGCAN